MKRILGGALVAALAWQAASAAEPLTPERIAAATTEAERLITQSGQPNAFINRTRTDVPIVTHRQSGIACAFWEKTGGVLEMTPPTAEHSGGFRCSWANGYPGVQEAQRPLKRRNIHKFREARLAELRALHPDLRIDREIPGDPQGSIGGAPSLAILYTWGSDATHYGCTIVTLVNDWEVTTRVEGIIDPATFKKESAETICLIRSMGVPRLAQLPQR